MYGKLEMPAQPASAGTALFCESYHMCSFWLFKLQHFNIVNDISGLLSCGLHRCRAVCFVTNGKSRRGCLLESVSV